LKRIITAIALVGLAAGLTACDPATPASKSLVLVTHDSFALSDGILKKFTDETGIKVKVQASGDAGQLVNTLVLTKDSPVGDVVFGIDNTFASRATDAGILENYVSPDVTDAEAKYLLPKGEGGEQLTPIDNGDVCINVDHEWFAEAGIQEPTTLKDLTDPKYANLLVVEGANTSSPGLAFLLATIAAFGENGWQQYWKDLMANGTEVVAGWTDAYYTEFSGPSSEGDRPLVVSYASSPPFEVKDGATEAPTGALLDTCFRQTEYAGVIAGTTQPKAARQFVDFLLSTTVQNDIPESMYVFPVNAKATLPDSFVKFAAIADDPFVISPAEIGANREAWLAEWAAIATP
jgi:thiamine transport system substrate-binding protein